MTKRITLTKGKFTIVDDDDYERLSSHSWYYSRYAKSGSGRSGTYMHVVIMNPPSGLFVDHINGNKLDNRKKNLRICTHAQNLGNSKIPKNNTSGYKGVVFIKRLGIWRAQIQHSYKMHCLGYFHDIVDAAKAYDKAAIDHYGEFARTNFGGH